MEAIFPHHLGISLPVRLVSGQPHVLDALAIALVPCQGGASLQPVRRHGGHRVEGGPEGFRAQFEPIQHAHGGQHMRRVGALLPPRCEPAQNAAALEQLVQQEFFRTAGEEAVTKCAQDGKVKARIRQSHVQGVWLH